MKKGKFIVFEGIDGCGKSTQIERLYTALKERGIAASKTAEPTSGPVGKLIREYLSGSHPAPKRAMAMLFAADRLEHIESDGGILSLLESGTSVICDRYFLSSCAYQADEVGLDTVIELNKTALSICPPDLTVLLDLSPDTALSRITVRGKREIYEQKPKLERTRQIYFEALEKTNCNHIIIDASADRDSVAEKIIEAALKLYK